MACSYVYHFGLNVWLRFVRNWLWIWVRDIETRITIYGFGDLSPCRRRWRIPVRRRKVSQVRREADFETLNWARELRHLNIVNAWMWYLGSLPFCCIRLGPWSPQAQFVCYLHAENCTPCSIAKGQWALCNGLYAHNTFWPLYSALHLTFSFLYFVSLTFFLIVDW